MMFKVAEPANRIDRAVAVYVCLCAFGHLFELMPQLGRSGAGWIETWRLCLGFTLDLFQIAGACWLFASARARGVVIILVGMEFLARFPLEEARAFLIADPDGAIDFPKSLLVMSSRVAREIFVIGSLFWMNRHANQLSAGAVEPSDSANPAGFESLRYARMGRVPWEYRWIRFYIFAFVTQGLFEIAVQLTGMAIRERVLPWQAMNVSYGLAVGLLGFLALFALTLPTSWKGMRFYRITGALIVFVIFIAVFFSVLADKLSGYEFLAISGSLVAYITLQNMVIRSGRSREITQTGP